MIESNDAIDAISNNFQIQIIITKIHVCHFESFIENVFDQNDNDFVCVHNENVVHIKNNNNFDFIINENAVIDIDLNKIKIDDEIDENIESYSKKLFQIVNCFTKFANLIKFDIFSFFEKFNVNFAINVIVKKNDFDVHLFQFSIKSDDESENDFVIHKFYYENENFFVIKIMSLFKITNYSANFITNNIVVEIFFQFKNSTIVKNFCYK